MSTKDDRVEQSVMIDPMKPLTSQPIQLTPTKPDKEIAADFRQRLEQAFQPILELCAEANSHGMSVGWNLQRNQLGRFVISIMISKEL